MRRSTVLIAGLLLSCISIGLGACSAIVGSPPGTIQCERGSPAGTCPGGQSCVCSDDACVCALCVPSPEQCNGLDEDCNGIADDGLDADSDGDGSPACVDGGPADCDDANPLVFPGNPEVCNGYDDDCELRTVETGSCPDGLCGPPADGSGIRCLDLGNCGDIGGCTATEVCRDGTCQADVTDNCNSDPMLCASTQRCDRATGMCVDVRPDGMSCTLDSECESGRCYRREALGLPDAGGVCSRACCTDLNCEAQEHCAAPGTGARGCLPTDTETSTCARPADCGETNCQHDDNSLTFMCAPPREGATGGEGCGDHPDCASNLCGNATLDTLLGPVSISYCFDPCGSVEDCPPAPWWSNDERSCVYVGYRSTTSADVKWVSVCQYVPMGGDLPNGTQDSACTTASQCRDGFCNVAAGTCADSCCNDDQCPVGYVCAPTANRSRWEMRCRRAG